MRVEFQDLSKSFSDKKIVERLSASFEEGIHLLEGPSGCGKSTLLSLIGQLDFPTEGRILFDGKEMKGKDQESFRKQNISILFQEGNLFPERTGWDNLLLVTKDKGKIEEITRCLGIQDKLNETASHLSRGENARLSLAKVLLEDKKILILDEPTGNLDEKNARLIYQTLRERGKGKQVFVATHDVSIAKDYADDVLSFEKGDLQQRTLREKTEARDLAKKNDEGERRRLSLRDVFLFAKGILGKMPFASVLFAVLTLLFSFAGTIGLEGLTADPFWTMRDSLLDAGLREAFVFDQQASGSGIVAEAKVDGEEQEILFFQGEQPQIVLYRFDKEQSNSFDKKTCTIVNGNRTFDLPITIQDVDLQLISSKLKESPYVQEENLTTDTLRAFFLPQVYLPEQALSEIVSIEGRCVDLKQMSRVDFFNSNCAQFYDQSDWLFWSDPWNNIISLGLLIGSVFFESISILLFATGMRRQFSHQATLLSLLGYRQQEKSFIYGMSLFWTAFLPSILSCFILYPSLFSILQKGFLDLYQISGTIPVLCRDGYLALSFLFFGILLPFLFSWTKKIPTRKINDLLKKDKL